LPKGVQCQQIRIARNNKIGVSCYCRFEVNIVFGVTTNADGFFGLYNLCRRLKNF